MTIKPLFNKVILKTEQKTGEQKTKSGIILADSKDKKPPIIGVVFAVGPDVDPTIAPDTTVLFSEYGFDEVEYERQKFLVGKDEDIFAFIGE